MIDDQSIRALAFLAARARPHGARRWDEPGVIAVIRKLADRRLVDVSLALLRAADDREANTPNVLLNPASPHWREKDTGWTQPVERWTGPVCDICSLPEPDCVRREHSGHDYRQATGEDRKLPPDDIGSVVSELHDRARA